MPENPILARESTGSAPGILSVSALTRSVRDLLEHRYPLLWVGGEISNFTLARSGHAYFVLKDSQAQVRCVMFRHRSQLLAWQPKEGMQVEAQVLVTLYEARGDFQLTIETMRQAGSGALYEQFLRLRDKLAQEGLFSESAKRALPSFPRTIGVVTSLKAAALRDILATLKRRNPGIAIIIYPVPVQGQGSTEKIASALRTASQRAECDVLILARGGGSIEDLWAFNDEAVARAIRACAIPVVTGIGHETDFTIADFAADQRAPTPTAAAELVSPDRVALGNQVATLARHLTQAAIRGMERRMQSLDALSRRLVHPGERLRTQFDRLLRCKDSLVRSMQAQLRQHHWRLGAMLHRSRAQLPRPSLQTLQLQSLMRELRSATESQIARRRHRLSALDASLEHLDPARVLARGYSVVRDASGNVVQRGSDLKAGDALDITLAQGGASAQVVQPR